MNLLYALPALLIFTIVATNLIAKFHWYKKGLCEGFSEGQLKGREEGFNQLLPAYQRASRLRNVVEPYLEASGYSTLRESFKDYDLKGPAGELLQYEQVIPKLMYKIPEKKKKK